MKLYVRECLESRGNQMPLEYTFEPDQANLVLGQSVSQIRFSGTGQLSTGLFRVTGKVYGPVVLECARCLSHITIDIDGELEEHFLIDNRVAIDPEILEDEDLEIHVIEGQIIDLKPYIDEALLVSLPYAPVCKDETGCKERMHSRGKDWEIIDPENQTEQEKIDPRFAKLAQLLEKDEDK